MSGVGGRRPRVRPGVLCSMERMVLISSSIEELVRDRRSVRLFSREPVPSALVVELLRDTLWAPSPHNSQPWRFTVLTDPEEKRNLANRMADRLDIDLRGDGLPPETIERITSRSRSRISSAPVVVLCSLVGDGLIAHPDSHRNALEWQMAVQSVGAALQTLFLLAHAAGIGTCWMAAPMYCPDVVRETLALPHEYEPQALVLMGYPAHPGKVRARRPLEEVIELR